MGSSTLTNMKMALEKLCLSITLIIGFLSATTLAEERNAKLLSLFNIVTFPNDPCDADTKNGTCYTTEECSNKGGTNDGSCASGYGVCCTFSLSCGSTIAENNTYWESGGSEVGSCGVTICPCSTNICKLRLDFDTFVITGPSTLTTAVVGVIAGVADSLTGVTHSGATQCIRREKGNCKICYAAVAYNDFALSGGTDFKFMTKSCCSYGIDGVAGYYDCVIIDGISSKSGKLLGKTVDNFCGLAGLATKSTVVVTANAAVADKMATLCTKRQPFRLQFQSDNFENSADEVSKGKLT